jgi:hypothetical protein
MRRPLVIMLVGLFCTLFVSRVLSQDSPAKSKPAEGTKAKTEESIDLGVTRIPLRRLLFI